MENLQNDGDGGGKAVAPGHDDAEEGGLQNLSCKEASIGPLHSMLP